jgi:hypothetical protein
MLNHGLSLAFPGVFAVLHTHTRSATIPNNSSVPLGCHASRLLPNAIMQLTTAHPVASPLFEEVSQTRAIVL